MSESEYRRVAFRMPESEIREFEHELRKAMHEQMRDTGLQPHCLVMGKKEYAMWCAFCDLMIMTGVMHKVPESGVRAMKYCGLDILTASCDSLLIAVRNPVL